MTTPYPHAAKFGPEKFWTWNSGTQQEIIPTTVYVYAVGTTVRSTLYTDRTRATPLTNNPLPTGVGYNEPGVDTVGNITFWAEHNDYDLSVNGVTFTVRTSPEPVDLQSSSGFDPATYVNF